MIKCLIITLLIWFLFSQFFFIREGFTQTINQNIRPKIRQLRINKETFATLANGHVNRAIRKLGLK